MKVSLVVLTPGKQEGKLLNIPLAQFVIGRDPQCHLRPASPAISKRHCALIQRDGKLFIHDFDSTNGTFVNEQPIKGEVELHNDDKLKVGPLLFSVKIEGTPAVNRPTPPPPTRSLTAATPPAEAKAPAAKPKPPAPPAEEAPSDDDSVAAMLLSLQDEGGGGHGLDSDVPEGSTVMDLNILGQTAEATAQQGEQKTEEEKDKPKPPPASTANAAKALLEKYMRRPR